MKICSTCGSTNLDQSARCGVCGGILASSTDRAHRKAPEAKSAYSTRRLHVKGTIGLLAAIGFTLLSFALMFTPASPLGFFFFFAGIIAVGSILRMFRGLPYEPNTGWHLGGDPDVAATSTRGSVSSAGRMFEVDRELEDKERRDQSD